MEHRELPPELDYFRQSEAYQVELTGFQGPLDLLLHLIKKDEIDIYDIPIARSPSSTSGTSR